MDYAAYWRHVLSILLPLSVFQMPKDSPPQPVRFLRDTSHEIHGLK